MSIEVTTPPLVTVPATATDSTLGPTLNLNQEPAVDMIAGTDSAVTLIAWLNPGLFVGQELSVRMIRRTGSVSGGVDAGNKAVIRLKVLNPETRMQDLNYIGFPNATLFDFPAFPGTPYPARPQTVFFKWTGAIWAPILTNFAEQ